MIKYSESLIERIEKKRSDKRVHSIERELTSCTIRAKSNKLQYIGNGKNSRRFKGEEGYLHIPHIGIQ